MKLYNVLTKDPLISGTGCWHKSEFYVESLSDLPANQFTWAAAIGLNKADFIEVELAGPRIEATEPGEGT